jgi:uncharacterized protein (TIGR00255 family)
MIKSMTGYGRRSSPWKGGTVSVEARSVNHRFCEAVVRLPRGLAEWEDELKREVQQHCARGHVELIVSVGGRGDTKKVLSLDRAMAKQYHKLLRLLQKEFRLEGPIDLGLMAGFRDLVVVADETTGNRELKRVVLRVAKSALGDVDGMRRREGAALAATLQTHLRAVREGARAVAERAPAVVREAFDRMRIRVDKLLSGATLDQARLNQELAHFADRCDVTEELARLDSHLRQFDGLLGAREPVGRTMDFLIQEMSREVNTIGSKANDADIAGHVVALKGEMEKLREQVQNIE